MEPSIKSNEGLLAIEIRPDGATVVYNPTPAERKISFCEFRAYQNNPESNISEFKDHISQLTLKHRLKKNNCVLVLHPSFYRLTLVSTPNVPRAEYKKAIRWQIKDIINYPLEDVAIDIFHPANNEENARKIYVIAAQNSFLQKLVNVVQDAGLYPIAIDVHEFAVRNLIATLGKPNEIIAFLNIANDGCILVSIKDHYIQFVRHFPISLNTLKDNNFGGLITELQRSFDYCQSELGQELPTKIFIPPTIGLDNAIASDIEKNLHKKTSIINLKDVIDLDISIDQQTESICWSAIGGALRETV